MVIIRYKSVTISFMSATKWLVLDNIYFKAWKYSFIIHGKTNLLALYLR